MVKGVHTLWFNEKNSVNTFAIFLDNDDVVAMKNLDVLSRYVRLKRVVFSS